MKNLVHWIKTAKPRDWLRLVKKLLPHVAIIISGMLIVFFVIDRVNKPVGFMTNEFHKVITFILAILSIWFAVQLITLQRRQERADYKRRLNAARQAQAAQPARAASRVSTPARSAVRTSSAPAVRTSAATRTTTTRPATSRPTTRTTTAAPVPRRTSSSTPR